MRRQPLFAALLISALFALTTACASTPATDAGEAAHSFETLSWEQAAAKVEAGGVLVDARGADSYASGHIAGAINVPYKSEGAYASLPSDKKTPLVFYCGGPACSASTKGAVAAQGMGYEDVAEYKGGYPEWKTLQTE